MDFRGSSSAKLDCLIVGGGPAGLTAAIYLARFRRHTTVIDEGNSRAKLIPKSHNYPGFLGISGADLVLNLRQQAERHGAELTAGFVDALEKADDCYLAKINGVEVRARRVLLATGIKDKSPDLPGLKDAIYDGALRYCPICDGFEALDKRIGVLGTLQTAAAKAKFLRTFSRDVVLLPTDDHADVSHERETLEQMGVVIEERVIDVAREDNQIATIFASGRRLSLDVLYPALGCEVHSQLGRALGARSSGVGTLDVDAKQETSVAGLFAAGDVVTDLHQISVATGHGAIAATAIHNSLALNCR